MHLSEPCLPCEFSEVKYLFQYLYRFICYMIPFSTGFAKIFEKNIFSNHFAIDFAAIQDYFKKKQIDGAIYVSHSCIAYNWSELGFECIAC